MMKPSNTITFKNDDDKEVGKITYTEEGQLHFEGNTTESAKSLMNFVCDLTNYSKKEIIDLQLENYELKNNLTKAQVTNIVLGLNLISFIVYAISTFF